MNGTNAATKASGASGSSAAASGFFAAPRPFPQPRAGAVSL